MKMRILVVDDKEENRYLLETLLKGNGYEVELAENGTEALEKLRAQTCDMIITDILMPVIDGFQLCREVKSDDQLQQIIFVFYTAIYTDDGDEELALALGADKFLRKPMEPAEFVKIIKDMVRDLKAGRAIRPVMPALKKRFRW